MSPTFTHSHTHSVYARTRTDTHAQVRTHTEVIKCMYSGTYNRKIMTHVSKVREISTSSLNKEKVYPFSRVKKHYSSSFTAIDTKYQEEPKTKKKKNPTTLIPILIVKIQFDTFGHFQM